MTVETSPQTSKASVPGNLRAAIYARTTVKRSKRPIKKVAACRDYCLGKGYEVVEEMVISELGSPATLHRPGLQTILSAAEERRIDVLVVYEFTDLTKKFDDSLTILDRFEAGGVNLVVLNVPTMEQLLERYKKLSPARRRNLDAMCATAMEWEMSRHRPTSDHTSSLPA